MSKEGVEILVRGGPVFSQDSGQKLTEDQDRIIELAFTLYRIVLCGNPTPDQRFVYEFMKNPVPGSLVVEMSTHGGYRRSAGRGPHGVGRMIVERREEIDLDEEEMKEHRGEHYTELFTYIETLGEKLFGWYNACFIRVPEGSLSFDGTRSHFGDPHEEELLKLWARQAFERHNLGTEAMKGFRLIQEAKGVT